MSAHPSAFELDALAVGAADETATAHVRECSHCQAHLVRVQQPLPMPAWAVQLAHAPSPRKWLRWPTALGLASIAAASVLLVARPRPLDPGEKGSPSIALYVKRGGAVSLWDGRAPLHPGDAIELKVAAQGYARVAVASVEGASFVELYQGAIEGDGLLPWSWTVDSAPGPEILLISFSNWPVTLAEQRAGLEHPQRTTAVWATRLELRKEPR